MLLTNFLPSGLTSMKLEKRIQKMYTFTYLRLSTFMLQSIQSNLGIRRVKTREFVQVLLF